MIFGFQVVTAVLIALPVIIALIVGFAMKFTSKSKLFNYKISGAVFWLVFIVEMLWTFKE